MRLKRISIENIEYDLSNLVIIVGPNGVGKTTLLKDIHYQFVETTLSSFASNQGTRWTNVVSGDFVEITRADWVKWLSSLKEIKGTTQNNQKAYAIPNYLARPSKNKYLYENDKNQLSQRVSSDPLPVLLDAFGRTIKDQNSIFLSVDERFYISQNSNGTLNEKDSNDYNPATYLATNKNSCLSINRVLKELFGKKIFIEPHTHPTYSIVVANWSMPAPRKVLGTTRGLLEQREIYKKWLNDNPINNLVDEGHGLRAALQIIYSVENEGNKIVFADEPELHLYPTTKYLLGQRLGKFSNRKKQIILSTHDSDFFKGLLAGSNSLTILRIDRNRKITITDKKSLQKTLSNEMLQGAFEDVVLIVEGIADQFVYRRIIEHKNLLEGLSFQVIPSHGSTRISEGIPFTNELNISSAVIVDYDTVLKKIGKRQNKTDLIINILEKKLADKDTLKKAKKLITDIEKFSKGKDLNRVGLNCPSLTQANKKTINELITLCERFGVFIVPIGELRDWVQLPEGSSPEDIFNRYRKYSKSRYKELTMFLEKISNYLRNNI